MSNILDGIGRNQIKGKPMLEKTEWVRINKSCHVLVDDAQQVIANVFTSYDEEDGDENIIWDVELEDEPIGSFVSLFAAKLRIQELIAEFDEQKARERARAEEVAKKTVRKRSAATKKTAKSKK